MRGEGEDDGPEVVTAGGWRYDPVRGEWWKRTGESTWTVVKGDLDNPPASA